MNRGYEVTLFSASSPGCLSEEVIDGINHVRSGGKYSVYNKAKDYYQDNRSQFDLVIDEINTRPFLTPKYVRDKPIIALIHQLAREFWFYETPFPLNYLGYYYLEKKWLSNYRDIPTVTVSESSRKDLEELGFEKIHIIPEGLEIEPMSEPPQKEEKPTLIFTGRLKKAKLPHHAIQAFSIIKKQIPDARMWVVGDGYMMDRLRKMNVPDVTFFGHVNDETKHKLMGSAHLALVPAVREGWGLVVTESNAMGTPAVAYNVPGLRDSVTDGKIGFLAQSNTPEGLAQSAVKLLSEEAFLADLSGNALKDSKRYTWDRSTDEFERILMSLC